jgi:outer membrane lipoprotein-sorting protein
MRILLLASIAFASACSCKRTDSQVSLLSQVKVALTERDAKVQAYRLTGTTRQQGQEAAFKFEYRAPNRMKGELTSPVSRTFSYDGAKMFEVVPDEKKFVAYDIQLPPEKSALFLTQTFAPS